MCGRFTLATSVSDWLESLFPRAGALLNSGLLGLPLNEPRYNIAPTQSIWVLHHNGSEYQLTSMRWGLVPSWADSLKMSYSMINARIETIHEKPTFRNLVPNHRCVLLADGYFEWLTRGPKDKTPYWIHRPNQAPFGMAGLWTENRKIDRDAIVRSATAITTAANRDTELIHDRMPAMLLDEPAILDWLNPTSDASPLDGIASCPTESFQTRLVGNQVGNVRNEGASLIDPFLA
jgi:putative SOS response-associated peptidase YedK